MSKETPFSIKVVPFNQYESEIRHIRLRVFIDECHIPADLAWDNEDESAQFAIAQHQSKCIAVSRLLNDGHIGRIAILKEFCPQGIGSQIIRALIHTAQKQKHETVFLTSQESAIQFYRNMGFTQSRDLFMAANIPHQLMTTALVLNITSLGHI